MKLIVLVCLALSLTTVASFTNRDTIIPEEEALVELPTQEEDSLVQSYAEAKKTVAALMQQGGKSGEKPEKALGEKACKDLANTTEDEVTKSVKAQQDLIDAMDNGGDCHKAGDTVLSEAAKRTSTAQTNYDEASKALTAAQDKNIDLGSMKWKDMVKGNCVSTFFDNGPWATQKTVVDAASTKKTSTSGVLDQAKKDEEQAKKDAARLVNQCRCDVMDAYAAAIKKANADTQTAYQKAWTKAAHIRCVVDGTSIDKCTVSDCPKVVAKDLAKGTVCTRIHIPDGASKICNQDCIKQVSDLLSASKKPKGCESSTNPNWAPTDFSGTKFVKCWDTSKQGSNSAQYHNNCDGSNHATLVFAKASNGWIFGAYSPKGCWGNGVYHHVKGAKLFSVTRDLVTPVKTSNGNYALYCNSGYGPTYGNGHDIYLSNGCSGNKKSHFSTGNAYETCGKPSNVANNAVLAGKHKPGTVQYEVYKSVKA